ncbi:MAG TPA: LuxR C-terminal-related transcriptional regulator [Gaiellaceae bacterium]|nr:LuxR C-terminal-related transcriptional regulator [Gaiellaceae bacterium]
MAESFRSGDALFAYDAELRVLSWNEAAERLTGLASDDAVGRRCWDVLRGVDERGAVVCHPGCSGARLAREGRPVPCRRLVIRTAAGRRLVSVSTIVAKQEDGPPVILNVLRNGDGAAAGSGPADLGLTPRQLEILQHLADGVPPKAVAAGLGITEVTVRNHVQRILRHLGCHSQLEAVAEARRRGGLLPPTRRD